MVLLAAAGIAEIADEEWAAIEAEFNGGLTSLLGGVICVVVAYSITQTLLTRGRFGMRMLLVWITFTAVGVFLIGLGNRIANG